MGAESHTTKNSRLSEQDYQIDVARESSYQNQDSEYHRSFFEWRTRKGNRFGYSYVYDSREHAYIDGMGFVDNSPEQAERTSLIQCATLLGLTMILMLLIQLTESAVLGIFFQAHSSTLFHSLNLKDNTDVSLSATLVTSVFHILRYLVPILVFRKISKIPRQVAYPHKPVQQKTLAAGIFFILMTLVISKSADLLLSSGFAQIRVDFSYQDLLITNHPAVTIINFLCELILCAVMGEILFRGLIMQTFRQFGDTFAIAVSCLASALATGNLAMMGDAALFALVIGLFTLRSGSLRTAIVLRLSANTVLAALAVCEAFLSANAYAFVRVAFFAGACALSMVVLTRFIRSGWCDFRVDDNATTISTGKKLGILLSSAAIFIWLVCIIITAILNIRFIN